MLLRDRTAVIYGGGGSIGGAVARAFAREGATVVLTGRTAARLEAVADEVRTAGGLVETAVVEALDERAVDAHADEVAARSGGIDISFNAISHNSVHGIPMAEMALDDFAGEIITTVTTHFLTARAAARHMIPRRSGVILAFGGSGGTRCATTTSAGPRCPSRPSSRCRASSRPSSAPTDPGGDAPHRRRSRVARGGHRGHDPRGRRRRRRPSTSTWRWRPSR